MDFQDYVNRAEKYRGVKATNPLVYFAPDEDAVYGRYWNGEPISQHPSEMEIGDYWEFWTALANAEQKEVLNATRDIGIAHNFNKEWKGKSDVDVVQGAIDWWIKFYPDEVKVFEEYLTRQKAMMQQSGGWAKDRAMKYHGAISPRVKALVTGIRPEMVKLDGKDQSRFSQLFFELAPKALVK